MAPELKEQWWEEGRYELAEIAKQLRISNLLKIIEMEGNYQKKEGLLELQNIRKYVMGKFEDNFYEGGDDHE